MTSSEWLHGISARGQRGVCFTRTHVMFADIVFLFWDSPSNNVSGFPLPPVLCCALIDCSCHRLGVDIYLTDESGLRQWWGTADQPQVCVSQWKSCLVNYAKVDTHTRLSHTVSIISSWEGGWRHHLEALPFSWTSILETGQMRDINIESVLCEMWNQRLSRTQWSNDDRYLRQTHPFSSLSCWYSSNLLLTEFTLPTNSWCFLELAMVMRLVHMVRSETGPAAKTASESRWSRLIFLVLFPNLSVSTLWFF